MTEELVLLECITDNPYQPRTTDNDEHIINLARSIAADGLLQKPTARHTASSAQLAFGHSRRKAFEWLKANFAKAGLRERYNGYSEMPLIFEDLTDEDMYRQAISENVQRKDLGSIELAKSMLVYRDQFGKNSGDIGLLFGVNGTTVRGIIRLLDLPQDIQSQIATGEISQSAARSLLTISRVDKKQLTQAVHRLKAGAPAEDVIADAMRESEAAHQMWSSWMDGKPRAGEGLWALETKPVNFPMKHLPQLRASDVAASMGLEPTASLIQKLQDYIDAAYRNPEYPSQFAETSKNADDAALMERIAHLLLPPSCAPCPFHASAARQHYCGMKVCHQRKRTAWVSDEMAKISKRLGIAVYDPAVDGKAVLSLQDQDDRSKAEKMVENKDSCLRLQPHKNEYAKQKWTDSNFVRVVLVGDKAATIKKAKAARAAKEKNSGPSQEEREKKWKLERETREACDKFTDTYACKLFASVFSGLTNLPVICEMTSEQPVKNEKPEATLKRLRTELARMVLHDLGGYNWQLMEKGPTACAKFFQGVATSWGVKLPADFLDVAKGFEPAVSAETEPPVKKKKE